MVTSPAFWTAIAGVIGAVSALVGLFRHNQNPAHNPPPVMPSQPAAPPPPPAPKVKPRA